MSYTPMPQHLEHQLRTIVTKATEARPDADDLVFVVREGLAQAYAAGHREGATQATTLHWVTKQAADELKTRAATVPADE